MPVQLSVNASVEDVRNTIHDWLDRLAEENYDAAFQMTLHDPHQMWTPTLVKEVIYGYGLPPDDPDQLIYKVTDWRTEANARPEQNEITFNENVRQHRTRPEYSIVGNVWYYLPLNGSNSDLTATFNILRYEDHLVLELDEIHVF